MQPLITSGMNFDDGCFEDPLEEAKDQKNTTLENLKDLRDDPDRLYDLRKALKKTGHPAAEELEAELAHMIYWMDQMGMPLESFEDYYQELIELLLKQHVQHSALYNAFAFYRNNPDTLVIMPSLMVGAMFALSTVLSNDLERRSEYLLMASGCFFFAALLITRRGIFLNQKSD